MKIFCKCGGSFSDMEVDYCPKCGGDGKPDPEMKFECPKCGGDEVTHEEVLTHTRTYIPSEDGLGNELCGEMNLYDEPGEFTCSNCAMFIGHNEKDIEKYMKEVQDEE